MSTLQPFISFRQAIDKLNDKEFKIFQNSWTSLLDREIISSMIFHHLQCVHFDKYNLPSIMNIITNIMNQREKSKNNVNNIEQKQLKLSKLPTVLIGETASFLTEIDYIHFELACRQTYISCNNPSTLTYLNRTGPSGLICRYKHRLVQHIRTRTRDLYASLFHNLPGGTFNHLHTLTINGKNCAQRFLEQFMQNNTWINPANIKTLKCETFENNQISTHEDNDRMCSMHISILCKLFKYFPNIEALSLDQMQLSLDTINMHSNKLTKLLPNLRIFKATGWPEDGYRKLTNEIINLFSDQLESLFIDYGIFSIICLSHLQIDELKFRKLKELKMPFTSMRTINDMLSTTNILERLSIGVWDRFINDDKANNKTQQMLIQLIIRQKLLQTFEIRFKMKYWDKIMKTLKNVLSKTQNINREQLRLRLDVVDDNNQQINISGDISTITSLLHISNIQNFMFITTFYDCNLREKNDDVLTKLLANDKLLAVHTNENQNDIFIVSNKNCNICGYKARWLCD